MSRSAVPAPGAALLHPSPRFPGHVANPPLVPQCAVWPQHAPAQSIVLDARNWKAADVLLYKAVRWSYGVWVFQVAKYGIAAQWSHAALYVGGGRIIEAIKGSGVVMRGINAYPVWRHTIRLSHQELTAAERAGIVNEAMQLLGQPYSSAKVRMLAASLLMPSGSHIRAADLARFEKLLVCSDVIQQAYAAGAARNAAPNAPNYRGMQAVTPAALAVSDVFTPYPVSSCQVP